MAAVVHYSEVAEALADAAESKHIGGHGRNWRATDFASNEVACKCGRVFEGRFCRKALASHVSAVRRQADKIWTQTYDDAIVRFRGW